MNTNYAESSRAANATCAVLVSSHGWRADDYSTSGATLRVAGGTVSLGLDGTVMLFPDYGMQDRLLGTIDLASMSADEAANRVISLL